MRATLDWSWELLGASEREMLSQLSIFEGGFTLEAVETVVELRAVPAIAGGEPLDPTPWSADVLQSLVEKSLVRRLHARRFELLRTVRDYAAERLAPLDAAVAQGRHAHYYAGLSERDAAAEHGVEIDNLVVACRRATQTMPAGAAPDVAAGATAALALRNIWAVLRLTGPFRTAMELAHPLLERRLAAADGALVERVLGAACGLQGLTDEAREAYRRAIALAGRAGLPDLEVEFQCLLADIEVQSDRLDDAAALLHAAASRAPRGGVTKVVLLNTQGQYALARSRHDEAARHFSAALELAAALQDERWEGGLHGNLGRVAIMRGERDSARMHLEASLARARALGDRQWAGTAHCNLGFLLLEMGELEASREQLEAASVIARELGHRRLEAVVACNLGLVLQAMGDLPAARSRFEAAVAVAAASGSVLLQSQFRGYLAALLAQAGEFNEAWTHFDRAEQSMGSSAEPADQALLLAQRALAEARAGLTEHARSRLQRALQLAATPNSAPVSELDAALRAAQAELTKPIN
jgi:tetratricopeptide (TPR) repeat protein